MKIAFRMDDITPDMDWKSFEAFEQLFERYGCYPLLGIVPDNLDPKLSVEMCIRDRVYTVQNPFRSQRLQR